MKEQDNYSWAILYVSSAMRGTSPDIIEKHINYSRKVRLENDITGICVLAQYNILILIEGPKSGVVDQYNADKKHPAHHTMIKLFDGPIPYRHFEDALAFRTIANADYTHLDNFSNDEKLEYLNILLDENEPVPKLIKNFIRTNS